MINGSFWYAWMQMTTTGPQIGRAEKGDATGTIGVAQTAATAIIIAEQFHFNGSLHLHISPALS